MLSTVPAVVWLVSALCLFIPAVLVVWATGRDGRKSRELRSLYRQVIAARRRARPAMGDNRGSGRVRIGNRRTQAPDRDGRSR